MKKSLKTIKEVHIRSGQAKRLADNKKGVIYKGFEVLVHNELKGESIDGNDVWYQDKNGDFYWGGGFEEFIENRPSLENPVAESFDRLVEYTQLVKVKNGLPQPSGRTPLIALLDTGVLKHADLDGVIVGRKSFVDGESNTDENTGHGTFMAGLISANASLSTGITGVFPGCHVLDLKVLKNNGSEDIKAIKKALKFLIQDEEFKPDIVNMSLSISDFHYLKEDIKKVVEKGMLVVGAAGEENIFKYDKVALLARNPGVIGVGSTTPSYLGDENSVFPEALDFFFANNKQWSTFKQPKLYYKERGDSVYTALISGLLALEISSGSNKPLKNLKEKAFTLAEFEPDLLKVYKND